MIQRQNDRSFLKDDVATKRRLRRSTGARASCPARRTPDGSSAGLEARAPAEEQRQPTSQIPSRCTLRKGLLALLVATSLTSCAFAQEKAGQPFVVRNPLDRAVERVTVAVPLAGKSTAQQVVDAATGEPLPTQCDVWPEYWPNRGAEALFAMDLLAGEERGLTVKRCDPSVKQTQPAITADGKGYTFSDGVVSFRLLGRSYRHPRMKEREFKLRYLTDFRFVNHPDVSTGIRGFGTANQCFLLGNFVEEPTTEVIDGPLRSTLLMHGKAAIFSFAELLEGEAFVALSIYPGKGIVDTTFHFTPSSLVAKAGETKDHLYLVSWAGINVDTSSGAWRVSSTDYKTGEPVEVELGSKDREVKTYGQKWVAARGQRSAFSVLIDDVRSTLNSRLVKGLPSFPHRIRTWNFDERSNYILPLTMRIPVEQGRDLMVRTRLKLYPSPMESDRFAAADYEEFTASFYVQRLVKDAFPFEGEMAVHSGVTEAVRRLADTHDLAIVAGEATEAAVALSQRLQTPLLRASTDVSNYLHTQFMKVADRQVLLLLIGSPAANSLLQHYNKQCGFADPYFPGKGKGRIALVKDFLYPSRPALFVGGDDPEGVERACRRAVKLFDQIGYRLPQGPQVRVLSPHTRPRPWMRRGSVPERIALRMCRGETEPIHLFVHAGPGADDLKCSANVPSRAGLAVEMSHISWEFRSDDGMLTHALAWHDAMRKGMPAALPAGAAASLWLNIRSTEQTPPGKHRGRVDVEWNGGRWSAPLQVTVEDIVLPARFPMDFLPMYSLVGYDCDLFALYLGWGRQKDYYVQLEELGRLLVANGVTVGVPSNLGTELRLRPDGTWEIQADSFFKEIEAYRRAGLRKFVAGRIHSQWRTLPWALARAKGISDEEAWQAFGQRFRTMLKERDLDGKVYVRIGDEPRDFSKWAEPAARMRHAGMRITVCHNRCSREKLTHAVGIMDTWCPNWIFFIQRYSRDREHNAPDIFSRQFFDERREAGDEVWVYTCKGGAPYANFTCLPTEIRFLFWDTYLKGATGILYYGGGYWSHMHSPPKAYQKRENLIADVFKGGDFVTLLYPDRENRRVLGSQRLALFGQAAEDIKLFEYAAQRLPRDRVHALLRRGLDVEKERPPASDLKVWWQNLSPEAFQRTRSELIDAITNRRPQ